MEDTPLSTRLTEEIISKAFEAAKSSVQFEQGDLVQIEESHHKKALEFLRTSFFPDEALSQGVGLSWCPEVEELCVAKMRFNLSFMLVDPATNDVMGMRMMYVQKRGDKIDVTSAENVPYKNILSFIAFVDEKGQFFQRYNVQESISFFGLGVAKKYRNRGIGSRLLEVGVKLAENLGVSPVYIKGEATSIYTKKIFDKMGFGYLGEVRFDECTVNGQPVITSDTGVNKSVKMYGKRLQAKAE